ncbi:hypothetical protein BDZ89DRAFT_1109104 [Hymenopellis radicata]|nr:hypothetical protein BDZ89DRAFT_1109104 [Hymenopellis radicata]
MTMVALATMTGDDSAGWRASRTHPVQNAMSTSFSLRRRALPPLVPSSRIVLLNLPMYHCCVPSLLSYNRVGINCTSASGFNNDPWGVEARVKVVPLVKQLKPHQWAVIFTRCEAMLASDGQLDDDGDNAEDIGEGPDDGTKQNVYRNWYILVTWLRYTHYSCGGPEIRVGRDPKIKNPSSVNANTIETVNTLFICRLPDFAPAKAQARNAGIPDSLKREVERIAAILDDPDYMKFVIVPCYERLPVAIPDKYPSRIWKEIKAALRRTHLTMCAVKDAKDGIMHHCTSIINNDAPLAPTLDWIPAYDSLLLSAWHDELKDAEISISFRPRWSLFPTSNVLSELEWPVIIPDVVFSVRVPLSSARLIAARRYHPGYVFANSDTPQVGDDDVLEIPILVVEYNKALLEAGNLTHRAHLDSVMTAALPLHAALGLETPLAALYFDQFKGETFLATLTDHNGSLQPLMHRIYLDWPQQSLRFMNEPGLHIWHVRSIISSLREIATRIVSESMQCSADTALRICSWPDRSYIKPPDLVENRRLVDSLHPPLVASDIVLNILFSSDVTFIEEWLEASGVVIGAPKTSVELPTHIREWLEFFKGSCEVDWARVLAIIEDTKMGIPDDAHNLIEPFLAAYEKSSVLASVSPVPSPVQSLSTADVSFSLIFCLYARDLRNVSISSLDSHSLTTHWMSLYSSLFSRAWQATETNLILHHCPEWRVHHCLRRSDVPLLGQMRPNFAFLLGLPEDSLILPRREWPNDRKEALMFDFAVTTHYTQYTGIGRVQVPVLIVEYVLLPDERFEHLAHLSMAMRSALALWEVHCVAAPVIGLLVERNTVTTVMGWIDEDETCIIDEVSDYRFDVFDPYDVFKLYQLVKAQGLEAFQAQIGQMINAHAEEALEGLSSDDYCSWKLPAETAPSAEMYGDKESVSGWNAGIR